MRISAFFLIFFFSNTLFSVEYYFSNSLAMEMESLEITDAFDPEQLEWILKVERDGVQKKSTLYNFGVEDKVIVEEFFSSGIMSFYSESARNLGKEEIEYDSTGRILNSRFFTKDGTIETSSVYIYDDRGRLLEIEISDGEGSILSTRNYQFRDDGSIRSFFRNDEGSSTHKEIWNSFNGILSMELEADEQLREVAYYNPSGKVDSISLYDGEKLIFLEKYHYDDDVLKKIEKTDFILSEYSIISMNIQGFLTREEHFRNELLLSSTDYYYNDGNLTRKEKTGSGLREKWLFFYKSDEISEEVYYKQGVLIQKKKYTDLETNSYTLELYNQGRIFMNLIFKEDAKIKEEFIEDGVIVRSKDLGDL